MANQDIKYRISADDKASGVFARLKGNMEGIDSSARNLRGALLPLAPAFAAVFSVGGMVAFAKNVSDGLLKIKDLSEATGATVENISALENAARDAGGSIDDVSGVLIKFNDALKNAERTKEVGEAIKAIGLDFKQLREIDPAEALRQVAVALEKFKDDGNKARITQELFGRSIKEAAPYLKELAEKTELVGTVTKAQTEQADLFNKELAKLKNLAVDAARAVGGPLLQALNRLFGNEDRGDKLRRDIEGLQALLSLIPDGDSAEAKSLQQQIDAKTKELGSVVEAAKAVAEANSAKASVGGIVRGGSGKTGTPEIPYALTYDKATGAFIEDADRRTLFLRSEIESYKQIDEILKEMAKDAEAYAQASILTGNFYQSDAETARLQRLNEELGKSVKLTEKVGDSGKELGFAFESAFEDAIISGRKLSDVLKGLAQDIARIFLRKTVTEPLAAMLSNAFANIFTPRAMGGPVTSGASYLVGENGPELFRPNVGGQIIPNHAMGGAAITMSPNIYIAANTNQAEVANMVVIGMQQAQESMWTQLRARGYA